MRAIHLIAFTYAALLTGAACASCTPSKLPAEERITAEAQPLCDTSVYCADVLGGADPMLLCGGSESAALWDAFYGCECSDTCAPVCGSNVCVASTITAECKTCDVTAAPSGCGDAFYACLNDIAPEPPPGPCDCLNGFGLPLCTGAELPVDCNGDALCPSETDVCAACCVTPTSCGILSYCDAAP
jgi:hypothetical protein